MPPPVGGLPGVAANFDGRSNGTAPVLPGLPRVDCDARRRSEQHLRPDTGQHSRRRRAGGHGDIRQDRLADRDRHGHLRHRRSTRSIWSARSRPSRTSRSCSHRRIRPPARGTTRWCCRRRCSGRSPAINATTGQNRFHDAWSQEVRLTSPDKQRLRWILGGYFVATDLDVMISVNRDLGGGDVVQETDPNIGGVNPTAPWNERFVAAVAPVFTRQSRRRAGVVPVRSAAGGGLRGEPRQPEPECRRAVAYNFDRNDNNAFAVFGQANFDVNERVEVSFALRYDRDDRQLNIMAPQTSFCRCFPSRAVARATCAKRRSTPGSRKRRSAGSRRTRCPSTACMRRGSGAAAST